MDSQTLLVLVSFVSDNSVYGAISSTDKHLHEELEPQRHRRIAIACYSGKYNEKPLSAFDVTCSRGWLGATVYLHDLVNRGVKMRPPTVNAMDYAAKNGRLDVVKFLHENREEGCTENAIDWAAEAGHVEVVKYLLNIDKKCTTNAIDKSAAKGHTEIVKCLCEHNLPFTREAVEIASLNGYSDIVKAIQLNKNESDVHMAPLQRRLAIRQALLNASKNGHLKVIKVLCDDTLMTAKHMTDAVIEAARNNHEHVVLYLISKIVNVE